MDLKKEQQILLSKQRIKYIDALRGFTMFLVVLQHIESIGFGIHPYESVLGNILVSFRMPMFFFISGYIAYKVSFDWNMDAYCSNLRKKAIVQLIPTVFFFSLFFICSLAIAILNPSMATILRLFSSISMSTPVIAPLFSSILAAKEVFFIMSFKISLLNTSSSEFSSLGFMLGNSSAESPIILNSELEHFIFTFPSVSSTIISPSGSFLQPLFFSLCSGRDRRLT